MAVLSGGDSQGGPGGWNPPGRGKQGRPPGQTLSERLTGVAYQLGWRVICRVPQSWAWRIFSEVADIAWRRQGPGVQVLEANLRRVLSWKNGTDEVDGKELRTLSRAALQSYAKARAEGLGLRCDVGLIERPERMLISLIAVGVSGLGVPYILNVGLWALAAGSAFTFWQRVHAVYKAAKAPGNEGGPLGDQEG